MEYQTTSTIPNPYANMTDEEFLAAIMQNEYSGDKSTWRDVPHWEMAIKVICMATIFLVSLIGNGLVLLVLLKKRSLRNITNIFIINLTIADILVTLSTTWIHLIQDFSIQWVLGPFLCRYNPFMQIVSFTASVLTMTAMALERFFGIVTPFMFCSCKKEKVSVAVTIIWLVSLTVAIPNTVYTSQTVREWSDHTEIFCSPIWPKDGQSSGGWQVSRKLYQTLVACVLYALPMVVMTIAYTAIIIKLKFKPMEITELNNNPQTKKQNSRNRVVFMLVILLAVFTCCWLPFQCTMLYYEYVQHGSHEQLTTTLKAVQVYSRYMADANSACNPVIFICFSQKVRKAIRSLFCTTKTTGFTRSARANSLRSSTRRTWV